MTADIRARIREENLGVYRASATRLKEDVAQEAEIAKDYRGRLVYELLQNADDAMRGSGATTDRILFRLTDDELWVGNSGRPLDESDVMGLCGIGASAKAEAQGRRRASIGHKGMGFKSVLEITAEPEAISEQHSFRLGARLARDPVERLMTKLGHEPPPHVPSMRFPFPLEDRPDPWDELEREGITTLFRFPLRAELTAERRERLAERLLTLPITSILFLKHLEQVDVEVATSGRNESFSWRLSRERRTPTGWLRCGGLEVTGLYRVAVATEDDEVDFLVAHNADVPIGRHRGGLEGLAWEGVELSEVSVAARMDEGHPVGVREEWRHFHVFLPTAEACPYPFLVNGAFASDLSRQEIRVGPENDDYNRHLMRQVAALFRDTLAPELSPDSSDPRNFLRLLDRGTQEPGEPCGTDAGQSLYEAVRDELGSRPILPLEGSRERLPLGRCVVPPLVDDAEAAVGFRAMLPRDAEHDGRRFPRAALCQPPFAGIVVDHGAEALSPRAAPSVLARADLATVALEEHESGGVEVDAVLKTLQALWESLEWEEREEFAEAVRAEPLFPVGVAGGAIQRVTTAERECFYPPRSLKGTVPLENLCFLMQELCWGALKPAERREYLGSEMRAWQGIFGIREFKFPDVMRASVLPGLASEVAHEDPRRARLRDPEVLAAICQLSGPTPKPDAPLPYERLGSDRPLFNLARLPVPCRAKGEDVAWQPAYRVYFGSDWVGDRSIEAVLDAVREAGHEAPEVPLLVRPDKLLGLLDRYRGLVESDADEDASGEEVGLEEDEEAAIEASEFERWRSFLAWLGVSTGLRPVYFHDVEDPPGGWLRTANLARPRGRAFERVPDHDWERYVEHTRAEQQRSQDDRTAYFWQLHDLDHIVPLLGSASEDATGTVASALFAHLALNWDHLQRFSRSQVALVPPGRSPARRTIARPAADEAALGGLNFWLWRLRNASICPTSHGPRTPRQSWIRSPEIERRFGRRGSSADQLLPVLDVADVSVDALGGFARTLGIREELTPSNFRPEDARVLVERLELVWQETPPEAHARRLRATVRPAYRNLVELLSGAGRRGSPVHASEVLRGTPLLTANGSGEYKFVPSHQALWAARTGTRERLGNPPDLFTVVLDAMPGARAPLVELFDVRILEDELRWAPEPGEAALDARELARFRQGLDELMPFLLARLRADRTDERMAAQDATRLRNFIEGVEPVESLDVGCSLDGHDLSSAAARTAFVRRAQAGDVDAFLVWGENGWPPDPREAETLASALVDALEVNSFEAFLALANAPDEAARLRLLRLAGAPLEPIENPAEDEQSADAPASPTRRTTGRHVEEEAARSAEDASQTSDGRRARHPIYTPSELVVEGVPVFVTGSRSGAPTRSAGDGDGERASQAVADDNGGRPYGGRTDLTELDAVGMFVTMTYERERLRRNGREDAQIFDGNADGATVFDVSTLAAVDEARSESTRFAQALAYLEANGLNPDAPGFDVLTLAAAGEPSPVDRLIELKSSGHRARTQEMTWNEWKSARQSVLRPQFFLYLVGNLRSDLKDARPFLRAIRDPFGSFWAEEVSDVAVRRTVRLDLETFKAAEELPLGVSPKPATA